MFDQKLIDKIDDCLHELIFSLSFDKAPIRKSGEFSMVSMSLLELRIIRYVAEHDEALLKDIRTSVDIPNSTLTSIIKKFENKELIQKLINPEDKRSFIIKITEKGKALNTKHRLVDQLMAKNFLSRMNSIEEAETFVRLVRQGTSSQLLTVKDLYNINEDSSDH